MLGQIIGFLVSLFLALIAVATLFPGLLLHIIARGIGLSGYFAGIGAADSAGTLCVAGNLGRGVFPAA